MSDEMRTSGNVSAEERRERIRKRAEENIDADFLETMREAARRNAHLPDH